MKLPPFHSTGRLSASLCIRPGWSLLSSNCTRITATSNQCRFMSHSLVILRAGSESVRFPTCLWTIFLAGPQSAEEPSGVVTNFGAIHRPYEDDCYPQSTWPARRKSPAWKVDMRSCKRNSEGFPTLDTLLIQQ